MHMQRNWVSGVLFSLVFTALLAACSSGGDGDATSPPPPPAATSAEGLWTGTSDDGRTIAGVVLDDGTYWVLYSLVGNPFVVAGAFHGTSSTGDGMITSSDGKDFNLEGFGILDATLTGHVVTRQSMRGTLAYANGGTTTFTSTFAPEYDDTPDLASVAGTYTGTVEGMYSARNSSLLGSFTVTVSPAGIFTVPEISARRFNSSSIGGWCGYTGALSPRVHGNVYDITFTHTTEGCDTEMFTGVAVFVNATNRLYILALDSAKISVFPFMGTKP